VALRWLLPIGCAVLAACSRPIPPASPADAHVPPFARVPYEPFSRGAEVAIALREWRLFGEPVDDDPPDSRPPPTDKPERDQGLWQRVGEYWWLGLDAGSRGEDWTGKHDSGGRVFPASRDSSFAWSAAFISYVMRMAGAGPAFPYSAIHSDYINAGARMSNHAATGWIVSAERPERYAPKAGDLICEARAPSTVRFDDLPVERFPAHCDIVVDTSIPRQIAVIGGNVDDAVTMKHVPVTQDGMLASPNGVVLDRRYQWMVVLRVGPAGAATTS
jgi:hypothetical protein